MKHGILIPIGFDRHAGSRYAIVQLTDPPKLVALRWSKVADVIYYLKLRTDDTPIRILDFKEYQELVHNGGARLKPVKPFDAE